MNLTTENILLIGSILLFISLFAGKTSYKFGVPVLILFITIGMLAGVDQKMSNPVVMVDPLCRLPCIPYAGIFFKR